MATTNRVSAALVVLLLASGAASGEDFLWEATPVSSSWNNVNNWEGVANQFPDDLSDAAIVAGVPTNGIDPVLNLNVAVGDLTILNGGDVFLGDFHMFVSDTTTVDGGGSSLNINDSPSFGDFDTNFLTIGAASGSAVVTVDGAGAILQVDNTLTINRGGILDIDGSEVQIGDDFDVNVGGFIQGHGVVQMTGVAGDDLINDGAIQAITIGFATLRIERTAGSLSQFDWDGAGTNANLFLGTNATMDIDLPLSDTQFNGTISLSSYSTLHVATAWSLHGGGATTDQGVLEKNNGGTSTIAGSPVTLLTGSEVNVYAGTLAFAADLTANAGSTINVATGSTLRLDGTANFAAAANINPAGDWSLSVNGDTTINQTEFNWDGTGALANVTTVGPGASLTINSDHIDLAANDQFDATLNINSGTVTVNNLPNNWIINGALNMDTAAGDANLGGDSVTVWGAVHVTGGGIANINSDIRFENNPSVNVAADADLELNGFATFASSTASFTGNGVLENEGGMQVLADTTINMPGGKFDLDGDTIGGPDDLVTLNSDLTLNVASIEAISGNAFHDDMTIQGVAKLTVNLTNPVDEWTMAGTLNIMGPAAFADNIGGSDFNLSGDTTIGGNSSWSARVDISGTVALNANAHLRLTGGSVADPNTIRGGTINGATGTLRAITDKALVGFGTINANVDFDGTAELRAVDGILTLNGTINDVGTIGTADTDGILDVTNPWNTNVVGDVDLKGGELRGATITNNNQIQGFGLISAPLINNGTIVAHDGGTLIVQTAANNNDWDGTDNTGRLGATTGDLVIRDNATFPFLGEIFAWHNREVFVEGFRLDFEPGSELHLQEDSAYRSTHSTNFGGTLHVSVFDPEGPNVSTLAVAGTFVFENGSSTLIFGDLRLDNPLTVVQAGASVTGVVAGGPLINATGRTLRLLDGLTSGDLGVLIRNEGTLELGASAGQVSAFGYEQTATGEWDVELGGTGLDEFDRLSLTGAASLAGTLDVSFIDGFFPALGQAFNFLSATGGISGSFTTEQLPDLGSLLDMRLIQQPNDLLLAVVPALSGDYNANGTVDAADYVIWRNALGLTGIGLPADGDGDGDVDANDRVVWRAHFGEVAPAAAAAFDPGGNAIPEPAGWLLLLAFGILGATRHTRTTTPGSERDFSSGDQEVNL